MIKIAIVGHENTINIIDRLLKKNFDHIITSHISINYMNHINTSIAYVKDQLDEFDGIIFTDKLIYDIMNQNIHSQKPWVYLRNDESQLQRILLKASLKYNMDIKNISIDSYDIDTVTTIYSDFGFNEDEFTLYTTSINLMSDHIFKTLYDFHKNQHRISQTTAITGISYVHKMLVENSVPSMLLTPNETSIVKMLHNLLEKIKIAEMITSQIVVISLEMDLRNDYDLINENEYAIMLERTKITEEIYKFAQSIQAAVVENEKSYLLFTTKAILEYATNNLRELPILNDVKKKTKQSLSVGIGFGVTAREAKSNSIIGKNKAIKMGGNQCFIVYKKNQMDKLKPSDKFSEVSTNESNFKEISELSGISVNNIYQIKCIMDMYKKDVFTSLELSKEFGNSLRSMNRIIEKLEIAGYVEVIGKRVIGKAGRPSRVLKFLI